MSRGVSALSALYGQAARLRRSWYERHPSLRRRLGRPVISVGNLVVGGSGKTPVVAALARMLLDLGERPAVLSRGYARRRRADGVIVVSDGNQVRVPVEESGDEPQMLARTLPRVPVLVSSDRYLAGHLAEHRFGATTMVLDDGFQHLALERTIDLLLMAPEDLDEAVLPSGRLREPLSAARSADAVLVYGGEDDAERISAAVGVPQAFTVVPTFGAVRPLGQEHALAAGRRVVAVAGIARPQRFFEALRQQGYDVASELVYRDHHWFTPADVRRVAAVAREADASLVVTTEKDAARLESMQGRATFVDWAVLPMQVTIEPAPVFTAWLESRL